MTKPLILGTCLLLLGACSTAPVEELPPAPIQPAPPVIQPMPPLQPAQPVYSQDARILMSQPAGVFTIQVMGAQNLQNIASFKSRYANYQFYQIESSLNGQPWHVLFYGIFNSKNEASQALKALPNAIRQNGPFLRDLGSVQTQIERGQVR